MKIWLEYDEDNNYRNNFEYFKLNKVQLKQLSIFIENNIIPLLQIGLNITFKDFADETAMITITQIDIISETNTIRLFIDIDNIS